MNEDAEPDPDYFGLFPGTERSEEEIAPPESALEASEPDADWSDDRPDPDHLPEPEFEPELEPEVETEHVPDPFPPPAPQSAKVPRKPNQLPDPKPPELESEKPREIGKKKPFVAKKKAPTATPPIDPDPAPSQNRPAKTKPSIPAKKAPPKKKAARKKPLPARPADARGKRPSKRHWSSALPLVAFAFTWAAIAGLAYFAWTQLSGEANTDDLDGELQSLRTTNGDLTERIAELESGRELARLGNEAIAEGHRSALYKLDEYVKNPEIQSLREAADAEIIRVEAYYLTTRRFRGLPPDMPMPFISEADPIGSLRSIMMAGNHSWPVRANAAQMLGEHKKDPTAAAALAEAAHSESSLFVVQECIHAFAKVTGFQSPGVFDSRAVKVWLEKNGDKLE